MATIPARLAKVTQSSGSWPVARARSRAQYRAWFRSAPEITILYPVDLHPSNIRAKVRQQFERNAKIDDLETVDILLLKGHQEYQEVMNAWKMDSHLMRWFAEEEAPARPVTFLDKFYAGRDEEQLLPAQ